MSHSQGSPGSSGSPSAQADPVGTTRIIVGFFMLGVIGLAAFATYSMLSQPTPVPPAGGAAAPAQTTGAPAILWPALAGVALVMVFAGLKTVTRPTAPTPTTTQAGGDPVAAAYTMSVIQRAAILEGAGLLGGVVVLMGNTLLGLVPAAAAVVALAWMFPSSAKYADFAARHAAQPGRGV